MKYEYICAGNVMLDSKDYLNAGYGCEEFIGGPATFAYTGIRIWTDSVMQVSRVGADYEPLFKPWMERNRVESKGFKVVCDRSNHTYGFMHAYGVPRPKTFDRHNLDAWQDLGFMKTTPEDIGEFTKDGGVKGVYIAQNCDGVFWKKLGEIKARDGFKLMWEIEGTWAERQYLDMVTDTCRYADIFSINLDETRKLFDCERDEDCIKGLQTLPVDMTLFRVGERGLYVVTANDAIHLPPVPGPVRDTLGCGNSSTGGALYAYAEGKDPRMVGIMANIASARNIMQYGVIPEFDSIREECLRQAETLYKER
ncbi:carbohydrate kinase family protein [Bacillota bacterium Meth-B3]|nr:carbohydrate kinase family protein [Christensenellaceae bacterium]MEA5067288.1 carbohydrate kinase family protein [Eubacteriales bacterium]MEA5068429.1 carbohydrate kinase family protein [Christensenellaceae bacterium]